MVKVRYCVKTKVSPEASLRWIGTISLCGSFKFGCAAEGSDCLEGESAEHKFAARAARDVLGNNDVSRRVVAAERESDAEQADHDKREVRREHQRHQQRDEDHHFHEEHDLAAEAVRQTPEADRADEDAEQGRGGDQSVLGRANAELSREERKRDARHEHDEPLEEFARGGERPDEPLHARHRGRWKLGSIRPHGKFVNVLLNRLRAGLAGQFSLCDGVHPEHRPVVAEPHQTIVV